MADTTATGRHHNAALCRDHHSPPHRVKIIGSRPLADCLAVATMITQCAGPSPHLPLDSTPLSSPRRKHCTRGPRHAVDLYHVTVRVVSKDAPLPMICIRQQPSPRHRSTLPRCFTLAPSHHTHSRKPRKLFAPSFDVILHWVAPAKLSNPLRSIASLVIP